MLFEFLFCLYQVSSLIPLSYKLIGCRSRSLTRSHDHRLRHTNRPISQGHNRTVHPTPIFCEAGHDQVWLVRLPIDHFPVKFPGWSTPCSSIACSLFLHFSFRKIFSHVYGATSCILVSPTFSRIACKGVFGVARSLVSRSIHFKLWIFLKCWKLSQKISACIFLDWKRC